MDGAPGVAPGAPVHAVRMHSQGVCLSDSLDLKLTIEEVDNNLRLKLLSQPSEFQCILNNCYFFSRHPHGTIVSDATSLDNLLVESLPEYVIPQISNNTSNPALLPFRNYASSSRIQGPILSVCLFPRHENLPLAKAKLFEQLVMQIRTLARIVVSADTSAVQDALVQLRSLLLTQEFQAARQLLWNTSSEQLGTSPIAAFMLLEELSRIALKISFSSLSAEIEDVSSATVCYNPADAVRAAIESWSALCVRRVFAFWCEEAYSGTPPDLFLRAAIAFVKKLPRHVVATLAPPPFSFHRMYFEKVSFARPNPITFANLSRIICKAQSPNRWRAPSGSVKMSRRFAALLDDASSLGPLSPPRSSAPPRFIWVLDVSCSEWIELGARAWTSGGDSLVENAIGAVKILISSICKSLRVIILLKRIVSSLLVVGGHLASASAGSLSQLPPRLIWLSSFRSTRKTKLTNAYFACVLQASMRSMAQQYSSAAADTRLRIVKTVRLLLEDSFLNHKLMSALLAAIEAHPFPALYLMFYSVVASRKSGASKRILDELVSSLKRLLFETLSFHEAKSFLGDLLAGDSGMLRTVLMLDGVGETRIIPRLRDVDAAIAHKKRLRAVVAEWRTMPSYDWAEWLDVTLIESVQKSAAFPEEDHEILSLLPIGNPISLLSQATATRTALDYSTSTVEITNNYLMFLMTFPRAFNPLYTRLPDTRDLFDRAAELSYRRFIEYVSNDKFTEQEYLRAMRNLVLSPCLRVEVGEILSALQTNGAKSACAAFILSLVSLPFLELCPNVEFSRIPNIRRWLLRFCPCTSEVKAVRSKCHVRNFSLTGRHFNQLRRSTLRHLVRMADRRALGLVINWALTATQNNASERNLSILSEIVRRFNERFQRRPLIVPNRHCYVTLHHLLRRSGPDAFEATVLISPRQTLYDSFVVARQSQVASRRSLLDALRFLVGRAADGIARGADPPQSGAGATFIPNLVFEWAFTRKANRGQGINPLSIIGKLTTDLGDAAQFMDIGEVKRGTPASLLMASVPNVPLETLFRLDYGSLEPQVMMFAFSLHTYVEQLVAGAGSIRASEEIFLWRVEKFLKDHQFLTFKASWFIELFNKRVLPTPHIFRALLAPYQLPAARAGNALIEGIWENIFCVKWSDRAGKYSTLLDIFKKIGTLYSKAIFRKWDVKPFHALLEFAIGEVDSTSRPDTVQILQDLIASSFVFPRDFTQEPLFMRLFLSLSAPGAAPVATAAVLSDLGCVFTLLDVARALRAFRLSGSDEAFGDYSDSLSVFVARFSTSISTAQRVPSLMLLLGHLLQEDPARGAPWRGVVTRGRLEALLQNIFSSSMRARRKLAKMNGASKSYAAYYFGKFSYGLVNQVLYSISPPSFPAAAGVLPQLLPQASRDFLVSIGALRVYAAPHGEAARGAATYSVSNRPFMERLERQRPSDPPKGQRVKPFDLRKNRSNAFLMFCRALLCKKLVVLSSGASSATMAPAGERSERSFSNFKETMVFITMCRTFRHDTLEVHVSASSLHNIFQMYSQKPATTRRREVARSCEKGLEEAPASVVLDSVYLLQHVPPATRRAFFSHTLEALERTARPPYLLRYIFAHFAPDEDIARHSWNTPCLDSVESFSTADALFLKRFRRPECEASPQTVNKVERLVLNYLTNPRPSVISPSFIALVAELLNQRRALRTRYVAHLLAEQVFRYAHAPPPSADARSQSFAEIFFQEFMKPTPSSNGDKKNYFLNSMARILLNPSYSLDPDVEVREAVPPCVVPSAFGNTAIRNIVRFYHSDRGVSCQLPRTLALPAAAVPEHIARFWRDAIATHTRRLLSDGTLYETFSPFKESSPRAFEAVMLPCLMAQLVRFPFSQELFRFALEFRAQFIEFMRRRGLSPFAPEELPEEDEFVLLSLAHFPHIFLAPDARLGPVAAWPQRLLELPAAVLERALLSQRTLAHIAAALASNTAERRGDGRVLRLVTELVDTRPELALEPSIQAAFPSVVSGLAARSEERRTRLARRLSEEAAALFQTDLFQTFAPGGIWAEEASGALASGAGDAPRFQAALFAALEGAPLAKTGQKFIPFLQKILWQFLEFALFFRHTVTEQFLFGQLQRAPLPCAPGASVYAAPSSEEMKHIISRFLQSVEDSLEALKSAPAAELRAAFSFSRSAKNLLFVSRDPDVVVALPLLRRFVIRRAETTARVALSSWRGGVSVEFPVTSLHFVPKALNASMLRHTRFRLDGARVAFSRLSRLSLFFPLSYTPADKKLVISGVDLSSAFLPCYAASRGVARPLAGYTSPNLAPFIEVRGDGIVIRDVEEFLGRSYESLGFWHLSRGFARRADLGIPADDMNTVHVEFAHVPDDPSQSPTTRAQRPGFFYEFSVLKGFLEQFAPIVQVSVTPIHLRVARGAVLAPSILEFRSLLPIGVQQLAFNLRVAFEGEMGADEGGLTRELFSECARELARVVCVSADGTPASPTLTLLPDLLFDDGMFSPVLFCARLCAMAFNGRFPIPSLALHPSVFHFAFSVGFGSAQLKSVSVLRRYITDFDAAEMSVFSHMDFCSEKWRNFACALRNCSDEEFESLDLRFEHEADVLGVCEVVETTPGGADILVDALNREEYIRSVLTQFLWKSRSQTLIVFAFEFLRCLNVGILLRFERAIAAGKTPDPVLAYCARVPHTRNVIALRRSLIVANVIGGSRLSSEPLRGAIEYPSGPTADMFFRMIDKNAGDKAFLGDVFQFWTGIRAPPYEGIGAMRCRPSISLMKETEKRSFPCSHTCINNLVLPDNYRDEAEMERDFRKIFELDNGFGLI
eukprot:gnl/Chilomastix_cuspidata/4778.p1 GENE.gnl/Chilomastix_cuspidata/4778~~gnl/Chilomastix_cuspidata/4778.p1  ORF type:complete len:2819 (-),score=834.35 gnl/Chilomastix_cuspidata/4778:129-8534(-)